MSEGHRKFPAELEETWEPLGILGAGAMGQVHEVRHRREGFTAAVKVTLAPQDLKLRARLEREAKALAKVQHPGVVRVFDGGVTEGGEAFVVMEHLEGYSLDEAPPPDPRAFMVSIAEALAAVHETGMLHRDIKPGNLFLTRDGVPKLVDFGLVLDPERTRLTATGMVAGTPIYMAPELLQFQDPSPAADWFAFGVTLHSLLEGRAPYGSEEFSAVCHGQPYPPPSFASIPADDPARDVLRGLLESDPRHRLVDAAEIVRGLSGQPLQSYAPPLRETTRGGRGWVVAALGAAMGIGFLLGGEEPAPPPTAPRPSQAAPTREPLRALAATQGEWAAVDEAGRQLFRDPPKSRLFAASWYPGTVPKKYTAPERNALFGESGERLRENWERLVSTTQTWLAALRAAGREHGDPAAALADPEVGDRLHRELLPRLTGALERQLLRWSLSFDPTQVELAMMGPDGRAAMNGFINASQELRFELEEWGTPPPAPLLHAWVLVPRTYDEPVAHGPAVLDAARRAVREARTPSELWWATRTLRMVLDFGPWFRDLPWEPRLRSLRELRERLPAVGMKPPHLAAVAAQMLVETARLGRVPDRPEDVTSIQGETRAWYDLLEEASTTDRRYRVAGVTTAWRKATFSEGAWYDDRDESPFARWYKDSFRDTWDAFHDEFGYPALRRGEQSDLLLRPPRP
jgi:predicted Ser/Thr protein kinase